jgi:hypothetical protein
VSGSWALANLFGFGNVGTYVLMVIGIVLAVLALWRFMRQANKTEPLIQR